MRGGGTQIAFAINAIDAMALLAMLWVQLQLVPRFAPKKAARNVAKDKECGAAPAQRRRGPPLSAVSQNGAPVEPRGRIGPATLRRQRANADDWRAHWASGIQTPTVGLEPTTTRLRALRSAG